MPSAFNTQSIRLTILRAEHENLWGIASRTLLAKFGPERYHGGRAAKIEGFRNSYGTILFWHDESFVDSLKIKGGDMHGSKA